MFILNQYNSIIINFIENTECLVQLNGFGNIGNKCFDFWFLRSASGKARQQKCACAHNPVANSGQASGANATEDIDTSPVYKAINFSHQNFDIKK